MNKLFLLPVFAFGFCGAASQDIVLRNSLGLFKKTDARIEGIRFGNWGSRPYEYAWAANIVPLQGKRVIDLGVGLPSQYQWYAYAVTNLKPAFYVGIDFDGRIKSEEVATSVYEIKYMDMASLSYQDKSFDVAFCISTFEHIPFESFMQCIKEAYRVLHDDGFLIVTLDEWWDKDVRVSYANGWNTLEQDLVARGTLDRTHGSFGLPDFLALVEPYFVPTVNVVVDKFNKRITSPDGETVYYYKNNRDDKILNSKNDSIVHDGEGINSCVSFVVLKKK